MLYKVIVQLKGYTVIEIEAGSEEEAELAAEDLWFEDIQTENLDVINIEAMRAR